MNGYWRQCPGFTEYECDMTGNVRRKDRAPFPLYLVGADRKYYSLCDHWRGDVHRQVFRAWGPPNPDPDRFDRIDHVDNDPIHNSVDNLRWSCASLNALNVDETSTKGWTHEKRASPYQSQIMWMGTKSTLGRFSTKEEARAMYIECKEWLQREYRAHRYMDKCLIWAFRLQKLCEALLGSDVDKFRNAWRQRRRKLTAFKKFLAKIESVK